MKSITYQSPLPHKKLFRLFKFTNYKSDLFKYILRVTNERAIIMKLQHYIIKVPKDQAAFTYFQLEANEGLCFYSTLDSSLSQTYREIELFSPISLETEVTHFLNHLKNEVPFEIVTHEILEDSKELIHLHNKFGKKTLHQS